jgi:pimeloyl-ACP methyl ester carboxylesterase
VAGRAAGGLTWGPCAKPAAGSGHGKTAGLGAARRAEAGVECAMLSVPVDYAEPSGRHISLALNRIKGASLKSHLGVLLVNPGGPGASGRDLALYVATTLPKKVAERYDIIGFDPRGVGASRPAVHCVPVKRFYQPPRLDNVPRNKADEARLIAHAKAYARACGKHRPWLLPHMSTADSARDMDSIRAALGERRISYLGYSYGTYLGAVYASMFPGRVRRLVLDSVIDPRGVWYADNIQQDYAFERRQHDLMRWVAEHHRTYHLGRTAARVTARWYAMRARLRAHPAQGVVGPSELDDIFTMAVYTDAIWPEVAEAFSAYYRKGRTAKLLRAYKQYGTTPTAVNENGYAVYLAVECRDARWPRDWATWRADTLKVNERARFMAWPNAWYNAPCAFWPVPGGTPVRVGVPDLPVLFIQAKRDAATPYQGMTHMRELFPKAALVTVPGGNHGVSLNGDSCVDKKLATYLGTGVLPGGPGGTTTCPGPPRPQP